MDVEAKLESVHLRAEFRQLIRISDDRQAGISVADPASVEVLRRWSNSIAQDTLLKY